MKGKISFKILAFLMSREEKTRTSDLHVTNVARKPTVLHPVFCIVVSITGAKVHIVFEPAREKWIFL